MKRPAAILAATILAGIAWAQPAAADRLDDVKARGKLIVGVSDTTPPFSFKKPGETTVVGYDLDIVHAVGKRLGLPVETVSVSSAERIPMLKDGKLDFVATSMTRTPERLKDVDFSFIYFVTPHAVIVRKDSGITSVHQLAGKKASSASTSTAGPNLKEVEPHVELVYVRDYAIAFGLLKDGKVDAFPTDETVLRAIVKQDGHPDDYVFLPDFTKISRRRLCPEERRAALQGRHRQGAAGCRVVRRRREDFRELVRPAIAGADDAQVQDQGRLNRKQHASDFRRTQQSGTADLVCDAIDIFQGARSPRQAGPRVRQGRGLRAAAGAPSGVACRAGRRRAVRPRRQGRPQRLSAGPAARRAAGRHLPFRQCAARRAPRRARLRARRLSLHAIQARPRTRRCGWCCPMASTATSCPASPRA